MLVEVVLAREGLAARAAHVGPLAGVDASVPRQLLVANKRLAAAWLRTRVRPLTWAQKENK